MSWYTDPRVYPVREDSELLLPFARRPGASWILEIGCGSGAVAIAAARTGARVVATDLNPHALRLVRAQALREVVEVDTVRTDLASGTRQFDRILANPPYLPTPTAARDPDPWVNLALDGGPDGLQVTRRLVRELPEHLRFGGSAFLLVSSRQDATGLAMLRREWEAHGEVRVVATRLLGEEQLDVWEMGMNPSPRPRTSP